MLVPFNWPPRPILAGSMVHTDITDRARTDRLGAIRAELLVRIRPVCREMPQETFLELVESMAAIQLKYELRSANGNY
jgi:hypothetical protein